jgi:hypothetical protein
MGQQGFLPKTYGNITNTSWVEGDGNTKAEQKLACGSYTDQMSATLTAIRTEFLWLFLFSPGECQKGILKQTTVTSYLFNNRDNILFSFDTIQYNFYSRNSVIK